MSTSAPPPSTSLYRKWRPQSFDSLKGQDVIRDTLFYALTHDQLSQSYLFCGPRGTGKTTTARLVAKLLNCQSASGDKPCNTCSACTTITDGANLDVIELDAASNRGIDEIRQLRESVRFAPTQAKYKVFIIDEVHMLTREAFNALLKTLEEPPPHTVFILATTEAHKIPATILSRCQRYDFRLALPETLAEHLLHVAQAEAIPLQPDGARFLARLADGSFRDALSLLDQVRTAQAPELTQAVLEELFGYVPEDLAASCLEAILSGQAASAHQAVDTALGRGADLRAFADQLVGLSQRCLEATVLQAWEEIPASLIPVCQSQGVMRLVAWVELLLEALNQIKQSPIPRLPLDIAIAKAAVSPEAVPSAPARVVSAARPVIPAAVPVAATPAQVASPPIPPTAESEVPPVVHETVSVPVAVTIPNAIEPEDWRQILEWLKEDAPSLVTSLSHARATGIQGDRVTIAVKYKMHADKINQSKNQLKIEAAFLHVLQVPLKIEAQVVKDLAIEEEESVDLSEVFEFEE